MFDVLPASDAHLRIRRRWITTSLGAHAFVILAAVVLTRGALEAARSPEPEQAMQLYVPPPAPAPPPAPEPDVFAEPPLEGFQTVPPVSEIPPAIPPIDLSRRPFDPREYTGLRAENGVADPVRSTGSDSGVYQANTVLEGFDPAEILSQPTPRYPVALQSAGVAGSVLVEFVIDTLGRVEPASVRMVESSHPAFEGAARAAVLGARFRPAQLAGRLVRQITQQRVRFVATGTVLR
jgi:periplasmic protein TonB